MTNNKRLDSKREKKHKTAQSLEIHDKKDHRRRTTTVGILYTEVCALLTDL